jgi:uncharacterized protein (DUF849 family)
MVEAVKVSPAPVVLSSAPNGARRTRRDHPALPVSVAEMKDFAVQCRDAGAALLHLHVRDAGARHILDADLYREATAAIRAAVGDDLVIQITTEAVGLYSPGEQMAVVRAVRPEATSIALRELIPDASHETAAATFLAELAAQGCFVQHILYAPTEVAWMLDLLRRGIIPDQGIFPLFVLGRYAEGQRSRASDLAGYVDRWNSAWEQPPPWSMCAFGPEEASCGVAALGMGGHARVGFENSLWGPDGQPATDPAEPIARLSRVAQILARPVMSAQQLRQMMTG